jgi:hypothetical protein
MKVKFTSGPKQGTIEHLQPSIANTLIAAGLAELIPFKNYVERLQEEEAVRQSSLPQVTSNVTWAVVKGAFSERYHISAKCSRTNCTALAYDAPPSLALESITFYHSCGGSAPEKIPAAVAAQYRNLFKPPAEVSLDLVNYYHNCHKSKGDGERVDLYAPQKINGVVVGPPVLFDHPVNPAHNNYGWENARPNPGDGQPADHSKLKTQFEQGKK